MLFQQHDVQWIDEGRPGAGHLLVFNNGIARPGGSASTVDEMVPPVDESGQYARAQGSAFGPTALAWTYAGDLGTRYYAEAISGAERMPNGNTLMCFGTRGVLAEVTAAGEVVWQYVNPVVKTGPLRQGESSGVDDRGHNWNAVFKVRRYEPGYAGFAGRDLTPGSVIEVGGDEGPAPAPSPTPPTPGPSTSTYPAMTLLGGGAFEMGDHHGLGGTEHANDELPVHRVSLGSFYIGTTEVTNRQYVAFLNAQLAAKAIDVRNGLVYRSGTDDIFCETRQAVSYASIGYDGALFTIVDSRADHPVVGVRWFGAAAYTNWLSAEQGYPPCYDASWACDRAASGYRLPTEAEWEYAGRGGQYAPYRIYPWGDEADATRANWPNSGDPYETGSYPWTTPAGFYNGSLRQKADFNWPGDAPTYQTSDGANAYGLYDMAGNVWEWCDDWYGRDYYAASPEMNPRGPLTGSPMPDGLPYRVLRGGNWYNGPEGHSRVSNRDPAYYRGPDDPNHAWYHVGFRVARTAGAGG
jgi:formylglycine-generating enzyme required for sulfatase activity